MILLEISNSISLDTRKITKAEYETETSGQSYFGPLINLGNYSTRFPKCSDAVWKWVKVQLSSNLDFTKFPKPNGIMKGYESNPGLWVFNDSTGIRFFIFSDTHRKNAFKGTSIELYIPPHLSVLDHKQSMRGHKQSMRGHDDVIADDSISDGVIDNVVSQAIYRLYDKLKELSR